MEFQIGWALLAGLVGTVVMSVVIMMSRGMGMTEMPPFEIITGSMLFPDPRRAKAVGFFMHYGMLGTVAFGLLYGALFVAFDSASVLTGLAIGAAHGIVVGVVFMPMMGAVHPRMKSHRSPVGAPVVDTSGGTVRITPPGFMGKDWRRMTPMGVLMGHAIYGIVVALVYGWLA